ncbi:hypothetical protein BCAMP_09155 [Brochothrix campestris FSL F6-1037]|uniref:Uncharacterized protein n=2 Tax=Brochothrix campestris TaxID=2757 RepID=W7CF88_9LIST|nr:hypothetical protein BCAMP_09155 [Brochothrix campestris FSL F6-1037]
MNKMILVGAIIFGIGLFIQLITAKWSWRLGGYYKSKNKPLSLIGLCIIILGLVIIVMSAIANGQLKI